MIESTESQYQPSLIVLIDVWQTTDSGNKLLYESAVNSIVAFCQQNAHCNALALATYSDTHRLTKEQPYYENAKMLFHDETQWDHLRQLWQDNTPASNITQTHPLIHDISAIHLITKFLMWHPLQLVYYCNHINPSIRNIYLLGFAWDNCLAWRSMGWKNIGAIRQAKCLPNIRHVFSDLRCILDSSNQRVIDVQLPWIRRTKNLVELDPSWDFLHGTRK